MLGRDHALSGALAFTAVAPLLHVTGVHLAAGLALTAGAGVLPDLDEPGSTIARTFGFLTGAFAWIVHKISGGHRKGTHSLVGMAVMAVASLAAGSLQSGAGPPARIRNCGGISSRPGSSWPCCSRRVSGPCTSAAITATRPGSRWPPS